jgi:diacylglycerol kinase
MKHQPFFVRLFYARDGITHAWKALDVVHPDMHPSIKIAKD